MKCKPSPTKLTTHPWGYHCLQINIQAADGWAQSQRERDALHHVINVQFEN